MSSSYDHLDEVPHSVRVNINSPRPPSHYSMVTGTPSPTFSHKQHSQINAPGSGSRGAAIERWLKSWESEKTFSTNDVAWARAIRKSLCAARKCTDLQHSGNVPRSQCKTQRTQVANFPIFPTPVQVSSFEGIDRRPSKVASPSVPQSYSESGTGRSPSRCPAISPAAAQPQIRAEGHRPQSLTPLRPGSEVGQRPETPTENYLWRNACRMRTQCEF